MQAKGNASIPSGMYLGVFGGGGNSNNSDISQTGTSFVRGGPLSVNAIGTSNNHSAGLVEAHIGYQWADGARCFMPAAELEGYSLRTTIKGNLFKNAICIFFT